MVQPLGWHPPWASPDAANPCNHEGNGNNEKGTITQPLLPFSFSERVQTFALSSTKFWLGSLIFLTHLFTHISLFFLRDFFASPAEARASSAPFCRQTAHSPCICTTQLQKQQRLTQAGQERISLHGTDNSKCMTNPNHHPDGRLQIAIPNGSVVAARPRGCTSSFGEWAGMDTFSQQLLSQQRSWCSSQDTDTQVEVLKTQCRWRSKKPLGKHRMTTERAFISLKTAGTASSLHWISARQV